MSNEAETTRAPWPTLPKDVLTAAQPLVAKIREKRGKTWTASVVDEENLPREAQILIQEAMSRPAQLGISPAISMALQKSDKFQDQVALGIMVLASHLYPMSIFIYSNAVENITIYSYNHFMVQFANQKRVIYESGPFRNEREMVEYFQRILTIKGANGNLSLTQATPICEVNLGAIARILVVIKPALSGHSGIIGSIRIPSRGKVPSLEAYVNKGIMSRGMAQVIEGLIKARFNILIAGETGSGKTTLMRVLLGMVGEDENLVVIEDDPELHLEQDRGDGAPWHEQTISLSAVAGVREDGDAHRISVHDLVRHGLRCQPDRLILGESRGEEIAAVCKALLTARGGSMTTLHAESCAMAIEQAVQYAMENARFVGNEALAVKIVRTAFQVVIHMVNTRSGRKISGIMMVGVGGNDSMIYSLDEDGHFVRNVEFLRDLPRLEKRLRPFLPSPDKIPPA